MLNKRATLFGIGLVLITFILFGLILWSLRPSNSCMCLLISNKALDYSRDEKINMNSYFSDSLSLSLDDSLRESASKSFIDENSQNAECQTHQGLIIMDENCYPKTNLIGQKISSQTQNKLNDFLRNYPKELEAICNFDKNSITCFKKDIALEGSRANEFFTYSYKHTFNLNETIKMTEKINLEEIPKIVGSLNNKRNTCNSDIPCYGSFDDWNIKNIIPGEFITFVLESKKSFYSIENQKYKPLEWKFLIKKESSLQFDLESMGPKNGEKEDETKKFENPPQQYTQEVPIINSAPQTDPSNPSCIRINYQGDVNNKLDILFLGDKYSSEEAFIQDVQKFSSALINFYPFSEYKNKLNIWAYYKKEDLSCQTNGRLVECDDDKIYNQAINCPNDQKVVIYNIQEYGGSGINGLAVITSDEDTKVVIHEFGHALGLADEYTDDSYYSHFSIRDITQSPNCASSPSECSKWNSVPGTGCFSGCSKSSLFKPSQKCMMNQLSDSFCPVCTSHIKKIMGRFS